MFARTSRASEEYSLGKFTLGRSIVAEYLSHCLRDLRACAADSMPVGIFAHENL
jgi:hypothetical protein